VIRGVELEDFMSYEHAFVPLQPGLNVVVGPNGSGKSTILHAIALALGQSHTERARRLVDLIRWGKDEARISLTMDNQGPDGKKLFPEVRADTIVLSRVLRRTGDYAYYLNDKPVAKQEVTQAMHRVGINPDNLLIVMHQLMVVRFAAVSPQEKLRMLEEALGFQQYRGEVLDALQRLRKASDEERTLAQLLENSRETFAYWEREYQRWQQKEELLAQQSRLEAEQAWAQVARREAALERLQERIAKAQRDTAAIEAQLGAVDEHRSLAEQRLLEQAAALRGLRAEQLRLARREERLQADLAWAPRAARAPELAEEAQALAAEATARLPEARAGLAQAAARLEETEAASDDARERAVEARVDGEVMRFKRALLLDEAARLDEEARGEREDLQQLVAEARRAGPRAAPRKAGEVAAELAKVREALQPLAHLSDEVVKVYEQHQAQFAGVRERAEELARNKQALRGDLEVRVARWREVLDAELESISRDFQALLGEASATGKATLVHGADIERAGLEVLAGFKGQEPIALETFAQSGGERSVALMAFLLALQQRIASPFRAVDEFDVHMDPRNRELITGMIVRSAQGLQAKGVQVIAITPAPMEAPEGVAVIVVQNAGAGSRVGRLAAA
jgi:chromosome segregation protein